MLLPRFEHHRPTTLDAAFALLDRHGEDAALYAGGTELLLAMKARVLCYGHLVDLKRIGQLQGVQEESAFVGIGALCTHFALAADPIMRRCFPAYVAMSDNIANIRVRVAGTLGGNLCFAEPHADPPALLAAMDARIELAGPAGMRQVPTGDFIEGEFTTARAANEILTRVVIPKADADSGFAYLSFGHLERPAVGIAAGYARAGGRHRYRLWAGAIEARPVHLATVEAALHGVPPQALGEVLPAAARTAAGELAAVDDLHGSADYKQHLAAVFMRRALAAAVGAAREGGAA